MNAWKRWVEFWDRREAPTSLWLCRVLVSVVIAADLLQAWSVGMVPAQWAPPPDGLGWGASVEPLPWAVKLFGASSSVVVWLWAAALLTTLMFGLGLLTRASGIALALLLADLGRYSPDGDRGIDVLLRVAAVVLALSGSHVRWSVDAWLWRTLGKVAPTTVPAWPRYLLFAQLVWMYNSAAQHRSGSGWWPTGHFTALGTLLCDPHYARFGDDWVPSVFPLTQVATAATMTFELGSPLMLLWTWLDRSPHEGGRFGEKVRKLKVRWAWLCFGVSLHLGIALSMTLGIFSFGVLAMYPVLIHPDELSAAWARLRKS